MSIEKKTAIFLLDTGVNMLNNYNFESIDGIEKIRLVLIISANMYLKLTESNKKIFEKIYIVENIRNKNNLCSISLEESVKCVKNEIEFLASSNNVTIMAFNEYTILLAAKIRELLGIFGPTIEDVLPFRDKIRMKEIARLSVRVPKFIQFNKCKFFKSKENYFHELNDFINTPFIIKPSDASGSLCTIKITDYNDFLSIEKFFSIYDGDYDVEEYIDGELYHCDIAFNHGKPMLALCSKFNLPLLSMLSGKTVGGIPLPVDSQLHQKIYNFCKKALSKFNTPNGITHTEVFINKHGEFIFLETACRVGGAGVIPVYQKTFGINLVNLDFQLKLGLKFNLPVPKVANYHFWAIVPTRYGKVTKLINPIFKSNFKIDWNIRIGDNLSSGTSIGDRAANLLVDNKYYGDLIEDFSSIADHNFFEVQ